MRLPAVATALALTALLAASMPALACHGDVTVLRPVCQGQTCPTFYVVASSFSGSNTNFAMYQESNGVAGVQRGGAPILQGGHDDCFQGPNFDARLF